MSLQLTAFHFSAEVPLNVTGAGNAIFESGTNNSDAFKASFLSELQNGTIRTEVADVLGANNSLNYQGMLQVLDAAAVGGMTASKFGTLETLVSLMNEADGISTSAYVENVSHSLIDGNPANAHWTGGASTPIALGDLSATSTQTQVDDLIGKWFLGTDLPSIDLKGSGEATYQAYNAPLFGLGRPPGYLDVNQGHLGDCRFVATLAEVALQNPSAIKSMITNNGNGTFGVRFFLDGTPEFVTVNDELPTASHPLWANGSSLEFANGADGEPSWAELVEKASLNRVSSQMPFTVNSAWPSMPTRPSRAAFRRMRFRKSPTRAASQSMRGIWLLTRPQLARHLNQARKWSSAPAPWRRDITAILLKIMFLKLSVTVRVPSHSRCIIHGAPHQASR